jgi:hypothetical protein
VRGSFLESFVNEEAGPMNRLLRLQEIINY